MMPDLVAVGFLHTAQPRLLPDIPDHIGNLTPLLRLHVSEFLQGSSGPVLQSDWWTPLNLSLQRWTVSAKR